MNDLNYASIVSRILDHTRILSTTNIDIGNAQNLGTLSGIALADPNEVDVIDLVAEVGIVICELFFMP